MHQESDGRLEQLELLIMAHEETLERFSELLRDQQRQIGELKEQLARMKEKLSKYEAGELPEDPHQPPPHY